MVLVYSAHANESSFVQSEVERAASYSRSIISLRIEDVQPVPELELFVGPRQWMDALTPPLERHVQELAVSLKAILGLNLLPPPPPPVLKPAIFVPKSPEGAGPVTPGRVEVATAATSAAASESGVEGAASHLSGALSISMMGKKWSIDLRVLYSICAALLLSLTVVGIIFLHPGPAVEQVAASETVPVLSSAATTHSVAARALTTDSAQKVASSSLQEPPTQSSVNVAGLVSRAKALLNGNGAANDEAKAVSLLREAAKSGDAEAENELGQAYEHGRVVDKSYSAAFEYYRKSAEQGWPEGEYNLARMYINGWSIPRDAKKAAEWYEKAANQDVVVAQSSIAYLYQNGQGVGRNYAKAMEYYQKSADKGFSASQVGLGTMYEAGQGVPPDYHEAAQWYEKAAAQGNEHGQYYLGKLYEKGLGVSYDHAKALELYKKSAAQGDRDAEAGIARLSNGD